MLLAVILRALLVSGGSQGDIASLSAEDID